MGGVESTEVTAGIWGFLVLFGLALACWFLFRSMNAHLRRMRYAQRQEELEQEGVAGDRAPAADDDPIGSGHRS